jgi:hypothetical protein
MNVYFIIKGFTNELINDRRRTEQNFGNSLDGATPKKGKGGSGNFKFVVWNHIET